MPTPELQLGQSFISFDSDRNYRDRLAVVISTLLIDGCAKHVSLRKDIVALLHSKRLYPCKKAARACQRAFVRVKSLAKGALMQRRESDALPLNTCVIALNFLLFPKWHRS
jgi:hypothetical protein